MIDKLIYIINTLFNIYFWIILVRCLLSFVRTIDWGKQPAAFVKETTDWYLDLFRRIIPPYNGIDFSPIVAIIALQILNFLIVAVLYMFK